MRHARQSRTLYRIAGLLAAASLALVATPAVAEDDPAHTPKTAPAAVGEAQIRTVLDYWTPRRMASAAAAATPRAIGARPAPPNGKRGAPPATRKPEVFGATAPATRQPPSPAAGGFPWDGFESAPVAVRTGKLFFTDKTGDRFCSASVVASESRDLIWTAGHCIYDNQAEEFHRNIVFAPFYRDGQARLGVWTARHLSVTHGWAGRLGDGYDLGAAALNTGGQNNLHIADHVGASPIAFFQPIRRFTYSFGYPALPAQYDGEKLIYCKGMATEIVSSPEVGVLRIDCDMREGASGGPWQIDFNGFFGTVISVSSHYFPTDPPGAYLYGPYHGEQARDLYERIRYA